MLGERLLEAREEGRRRKEGVCQEDTSFKGVHLEMGCFLTLLSFLKVYSVLPFKTIQVLYLHQAAFVQRHILN